MTSTPLGLNPPRIGIRRLEFSDAEPLFALTRAQGGDLDAFAWRSGIRSVDDETAFIEWARLAERDASAFCRAIRVDGALAGCASLYRPHPGCFPVFEPTLQMGYWVGKAFRGQGASWRAMNLLREEIAGLFPPGSSAGLRTRSGNTAARACAARLGLMGISGLDLPSQFDSLDHDILCVGPLIPAIALGPRKPRAHRSTP